MPGRGSRVTTASNPEASPQIGQFLWERLMSQFCEGVHDLVDCMTGRGHRALNGYQCLQGSGNWSQISEKGVTDL